MPLSFPTWVLSRELELAEARISSTPPVPSVCTRAWPDGRAPGARRAREAIEASPTRAMPRSVPRSGDGALDLADVRVPLVRRRLDHGHRTHRQVHEVVDGKRQHVRVTGPAVFQYV